MFTGLLTSQRGLFLLSDRNLSGTQEKVVACPEQRSVLVASEPHSSLWQWKGKKGETKHHISVLRWEPSLPRLASGDLILLDFVSLLACDCLSLSHSQQWVTSRQMRFEGGFQGRCNKLVDGCYSFWQAGLLPLLHRALHAQGEWAAVGRPGDFPWLLISQEPERFLEGSK